MNASAEIATLLATRFSLLPKPVYPYITRSASGIDEVRCKCCGSPIQGLVADDSFAETRKVKGRDVIVERLKLCTLAGYTEVKISFDDGSHHVTSLCEACASKLTMDEAEWVYCCDLNDWMAAGDGYSYNFWVQQLARNPVDFQVYPSGMVAV